MIIKSIIRDILKSARTLLLKFKYQRSLGRIRKKYGNDKIIVAFCVSEIAKWKSQSLYDCLCQSDKYRPVIYIYPSPLDCNDKSANIELSLEEKINYFKSRKMDILNIWDNDTKQCKLPCDSYPDIIFYQQPWDIPPFLPPTITADYSLTFYIPYYLVNNFDIDIEFKQPLHFQLFGYIVQSEKAAEFYTQMLTKRHYAGKCLGLGHTIVDYLTTKVNSLEENSVIYAPHFSFPVPGQERILTYSTFLENGKLILKFAKQHPEINWIFKPHPRLKWELKNTGVWTEEEINSYYEEWAKIGVVCTNSDYAEHFQKSFAMITDCGSFLTEYSCMDKPLIRLYYHKDNLPPNPILEKLYNTFYYAHNNDELMKLLDKIITQREDPNQNERHREVTSLGLNRSDSARTIVNYLDKLFKES